MRWYDVLMGIPSWKVYLLALWESLALPRTTLKRECLNPKRCGKRHRFALIQTKKGTGRIVLVHVEF